MGMLHSMLEVAFIRFFFMVCSTLCTSLSILIV